MSSRISQFLLLYRSLFSYYGAFLGNIGCTARLSPFQHVIYWVEINNGLGCLPPPYVDLGRIDSFVFLTFALTFTQGLDL
jgi:hypothetical protein